jgi:hypothetical protein
MNISFIVMNRMPEERADSDEQFRRQSVAASDADLDAIIAELDQDYSGKLPKQAIRDAQRHREEIIPRLFELLRRATEATRQGESPRANGHLFALFLLTEFRAKEALPVIVDAVSLPGEGAFDLFGDAITEDLCRILAALADESTEVVDQLIANRSINKYVRSAAVRTYLHWVRDGHLTREQALEQLREHLRQAIVNRDVEGASPVVAELVSYAPREAVNEIQEAFRQGLVEDGMVGWDTVQRSIAEGDAGFQWQLEHCRPTGIQDAVDELSRWAFYREADERVPSARSTTVVRGRADTSASPRAESDWEHLEGDESRRASTTITNSGPRVGRNDPCPCGSGKKYKKCCG